jgi:hypothetical protein
LSILFKIKKYGLKGGGKEKNLHLKDGGKEKDFTP